MLIYYLPLFGKMNLVSAVLAEQRLKLGDRLVIGTQPRINHTRKSLGRKLFKIFTSIQQFQKHASSVIVMAMAVIVIILIATFTYVSRKLNISFVDALYFAVGMITGAGGNEKVVENPPNSIKLFTVFMMLAEAVVFGIWYATLTYFVLGTRLKQFWDAARIPQFNHYIVCGLSGIGIRIIQQLHASRHEVVVIETDPNNRFVNTARGMSIPVIIADVSFRTTLQTSNIDTAAAVLAVTNNDATNLEIALKAKGLTPKISVIVHYPDPDFAGMAQQVFDFEAVLSPAELAASAFAAAALGGRIIGMGGRIIGNGIIADNLWFAFATLITPNHPFCGQWVKDVARYADFVPLYVETNHQTLHGWDLLDTNLSTDYILYLTIPANWLYQLWREEQEMVS